MDNARYSIRSWYVHLHVTPKYLSLRVRFSASTQTRYGNHSESHTCNNLLADLISSSYSMIFPPGAQSWKRLRLPSLLQHSTLLPPKVHHLKNESRGLRMPHQTFWASQFSWGMALMIMCVFFSCLCCTDSCPLRGKQTTSLIRPSKRPLSSSFTQAVIISPTSVPISSEALFPWHA